MNGMIGEPFRIQFNAIIFSLFGDAPIDSTISAPFLSIPHSLVITRDYHVSSGSWCADAYNNFHFFRSLILRCFRVSPDSTPPSNCTRRRVVVFCATTDERWKKYRAFRIKKSSARSTIWNSNARLTYLLEMEVTHRVAVGYEHFRRDAARTIKYNSAVYCSSSALSRGSKLRFDCFYGCTTSMGASRQPNLALSSHACEARQIFHFINE